MGETGYGKCRNLSVNWEFSKINSQFHFRNDSIILFHHICTGAPRSKLAEYLTGK